MLVVADLFQGLPERSASDDDQFEIRAFRKHTEIRSRFLYGRRRDTTRKNPSFARCAASPTDHRSRQGGGGMMIGSIPYTDEISSETAEEFV